jgi:hypothetical protein
LESRLKLVLSSSGSERKVVYVLGELQPRPKKLFGFGLVR